MQNRLRLFDIVCKGYIHSWGSLDFDSSRQAVSLFSSPSVVDFEWSKNFSVLTVVFVQGYTVSLAIGEKYNSIVYACTQCNKQDQSICIHAMAARMTCREILTGEYSYYKFPYTEEQKNYFTEKIYYGDCVDNNWILNGLPNGISVCLVSNDSYRAFDRVQVTWYVINDGKIMLPRECIKIPELLVFYDIIYQQQNEREWIKFLGMVAQKYPFYMYDAEKFNKISWAQDFKVSPCVEVDIVNNDSMRVRRVALYNGIVLDNLVSLGNHLVLDANTASVTVADDLCWRYAHELEKKIHSSLKKRYDGFPVFSDAFEISTQIFNEQMLIADQDIIEGFVFKDNGTVLLPVHSPAQAKMIISEYDDQASRLRGDILFAGISLRAWNIPGINSLFKPSQTAKKHFQAKLAAIWAKAYFAASCATNKKELAAIIDETTKILASKVEMDVKKRISTPFNTAFKKMQSQEQRTYVFIVDKKIHYVTVNHALYWLFMALPCIVLDKCKPTFFVGEAHVNTKNVYACLGVLRELLCKYSIDLYIDAKQVKAAQLDIKIDTRRKETDWFELHPEVYYDKQKISEKEWRYIVEGNGLWLRGNEMFVVDSQACTALGLLSGWMNDSQKTMKEKAIAVVPRLRVFDLIELRKNGVTLKVSDKDEKLLHNLSHFEAIPKIAVPNKLQCTLREYQKEGYYWLAFLYKHQFGACLADDMGLGKTVQAIAFLGALKEKIIESESKKPHLIVVPTSLVFNWVNELKTFYPDLKVQEYCTTKKSVAFDSADIFITTYDIVRRDDAKLSKIPFNIIIFDEAQAIKNITAKRTSAARLLQGDFKLCITGTPLENHVGEYYSIMDLAIPGLLQPYSQFKSSVDSGAGRIVQQTKPFILRRTKAIIAQELPEKIESDVYFYMTDKQRALYTRITQDIRNEVAQAYKHKTKGQASIVALTALLRLRQICISPELVIPAKKAEMSPKIEYLSEQLPNLIQEGHAALIFSQFTSCLDVIETELQKVGIKYARIDGSVSLAKRKVIIESFQENKDVDILLMSLKTGGVGLNLTRASYIFHVDPWWNAAAENQASDRAYRIGQKNTVIVNRLLMHHSIEEKMLVLKKSKQEIFDAIVNGAGEKVGGALSQSDFDFLLG